MPPARPVYWNPEMVMQPPSSNVKPPPVQHWIPPPQSVMMTARQPVYWNPQMGMPVSSSSMLPQSQCSSASQNFSGQQRKTVPPSQNLQAPMMRYINSSGTISGPSQSSGVLYPQMSQPLPPSSSYNFNPYDFPAPPPPQQMVSLLPQPNCTRSLPSSPGSASWHYLKPIPQKQKLSQQEAEAMARGDSVPGLKIGQWVAEDTKKKKAAKQKNIEDKKPSKEVKVGNMVCTAKLSIEFLNLKEVATTFWNCHYEPRAFPACRMQLRNPRTTVMIFSTGKIVVLGAKTEETCRTSARRVARMIQKKINPNVKLHGLEVCNVVGTVKLGHRVDLISFVNANKAVCDYNPETFSGVTYTMKRENKKNVTLTVFSTGKVNFMGVEAAAELQEAYDRVKPLLELYKVEAN